ncbi:hypothetical protein NKG05_21400 [Oerskovia sp. M15]
MSLAQARRVALAAQGLHTPRPDAGARPGRSPCGRRSAPWTGWGCSRSTRSTCWPGPTSSPVLAARAL